MFHSVKMSLDAAMKRSVAEHVGIHTKRAEILSEDDEGKLWIAGELGSSNPVQLMQTMFDYNGLHFGLRGGDEHRSLSVSQFTIKRPEGELPYIEFAEKIGKTFKGGLAQRKATPNIKRFYANVDQPDRCHVQLFTKFLEVRPKNTDVFYLQPIRKIKQDVWYSSQPIGHNPLRQMLSKMCQRAGVEGHKTNHSLRATLATRLHQANVGEQIAMEMTGHRSVEGIRAYKRTAPYQIQEASLHIDIRNNHKTRTMDIKRPKDSNIHFEFNNCNVTIYNKNTSD